LAAVIWPGREDWLAVRVANAVWQAPGSAAVAVDVALGAVVVVDGDEDVVPDDVDEAAVLPVELPLAAAVTVTVTVFVTVAVSVTVLVTVATGTHCAMKVVSAVSSVCTPT